VLDLNHEAAIRECEVKWMSQRVSNVKNVMI
jgi:hypothetical protein